ncbi:MULTISPECIES: sensor histidine kinase [unclassified Saccharothrix]|uniref:sensor histidine kinase n=1 Tax=unclassified Saccharothrix TaxID=2593673 RepID=UPI00307F3E30
MRFPGWLRVVGPPVAGAVDLFVDEPADPLQLGVGLVGLAALLVRTRFPVAVLLVNLAAVALGPAWVAGGIALYTVARLRRNRWLLGAFPVLFAVALWWPYPFTAEELAKNTADHSLWVRAVVFPVAAVALGRLATVSEELRVRLAELTSSREREDALLADRVLATERARLAREMHDVVAHQVSLISLQAGALLVSDADPRKTAGAIRDLAVRTLVELRHMVGVLRAAGGRAGDLTPQPRLSDLPRLVDGSALEVDVPEPCPEPVERAAFRIVQESLTNARKHAPGATTHVRVRLADDRLHVEVHNGPPDHEVPPLDLPGGGHGLVGLHERVAILGGEFEAGPTPDGGYRVRAELPVSAHSASPATARPNPVSPLS